ncbi:four and a half LIM domains protein 5-like [Pseudoliparis swirei]|uniref:four and a half LIM domains protein 5-like n=1 Tax=Pseudoliparis swirei TaxID=2059687 RepID=UPI0024BEE790|nr:four and a half LIM domains protein 5-like [Pseudoliparis swirei]
MSTSERFDCHYCKDSLLGKKYIMKEDTQYCTKCYENLFSNSCEGCTLAITCNSKDLSYKDRHWHEECFKCAKCSRSLAEKAFAAKDDVLLCTECHAHGYSSKCTTCKKTIMPGMICWVDDGDELASDLQYRAHWASLEFPTPPLHLFGPRTLHWPGLDGCRYILWFALLKSRFSHSSARCVKCVPLCSVRAGLAGAKYISFEERQWHSECFSCSRCSVTLVGRGFLTQRDDIMCTDCGREK